jgi:Holliday junction resolvase RusA-like endonuclease
VGYLGQTKESIGYQIMLNVYEFTVNGLPKTKGSYRGTLNKHTGRVVVFQDCKQTKPWQKAIEVEAKKVAPPEPLTGPICVSAIFKIQRGKTVKREFPTVKPDIDKLERVVLDALTGIFYVDDGQVINVHTYKLYDTSPGVDIAIQEVTELPCLI